MRKIGILIILFIVYVLSGLGICYSAQDVEMLQQKGLKIARLMDEHDQNWIYQISNATMILKNRQGEESVRKIQIKILEVQGDGDKSLTIFKSPSDIKDTTLLSHSHIHRDDDQWLYLPAMKRVKRISSHNKSGPFMGSEFAYEDISNQEADRYTYKYLRDETFSKYDCHVIERYPVYANSGYSKQVVWIDKIAYRPQKIDFYDRKGSLLKTLIYKDYKERIKGIYRADIFAMSNHQNGKSTTIYWNTFNFTSKFNSIDFNKSSLSKR